MLSGSTPYAPQMQVADAKVKALSKTLVHTGRSNVHDIAKVDLH
jgi:hypothetical protein